MKTVEEIRADVISGLMEARGMLPDGPDDLVVSEDVKDSIRARITRILDDVSDG